MGQDAHSRLYDAVVVGSGVTGGWVAKKLAGAGLKVALLEAGRNVSPEEFTEHLPAFRLDYRNMSPEIVRTRPIQKMCYACMEYNYDWFVNDLENPYATPEGVPFTWQRLRIVGGGGLWSGGGSPIDSATSTSRQRARTDTARIGRCPTKISSPSTTKSRITLGLAAIPRETRRCGSG